MTSMKNDFKRIYEDLYEKHRLTNESEQAYLMKLLLIFEYK